MVDPVQKNICRFYQRFGSSLNPKNYANLSQQPGWDTLWYVIILVALAVLLCFITALPAIINMPSYMYEQLSSFETLEFTINAKTTEPVFITNNYPIVAIDTSSSITHNALFSITKDHLEMNLGSDPVVVGTMGYNNLLENRVNYANIFGVLSLLFFPVIYLVLFIIFTFKYLVIIFITALFGFIIDLIIDFRLSFSSFLKIAIYSLWIIVIPELILLPYLGVIIYPTIVIYVLFFIVCYVVAGIAVAKEQKRHPQKDSD